MTQDAPRTKQEAVRAAGNPAADERVRTMQAALKPDQQHPSKPKPAVQAVARANGAQAALKDAERNAMLVKRQAAVLRLVAEFIDQPSLSMGLTALVNELHQRLRCERVVLGLVHNDKLRIEAISQQVEIDARSAEARLLVDAMTEACDQDCALHFPGTRPSLSIVEAHRALVAGRDGVELYTLPLCQDGDLVGALLFERVSKQSWSVMTLDLLRQMAQVATPMIVMRRRTERGVGQLLRAATRSFLEKFLRPKNLALKCGALLATGILVGAYLLPTTHHVTADSELVPMERRVITAPIQGYIEAVNVGAGDLVEAGQTLLRLDTEDLELERTKWHNEISSLKSESRSAMASYDRNEMAVVRAKKKQAEAQLALVEQQISRAELVAPKDGIIVSGDLTQAIGAPVERGEALLEIAPDEGYQVQLLVDETDVAYLVPGQFGKLTLKASPDNGLAFKVAAIHPISQAEDGQNRFRVDADLLVEPVGLRPGQTGVAKVSVGEARTLWIWTHRFVEWAKLRLWEWLV
ncbi:MAG: efflux RND transporter periplasmic adaptor subunit [Pseudomonadales bacterium]